MFDFLIENYPHFPALLHIIEIKYYITLLEGLGKKKSADDKDGGNEVLRMKQAGAELGQDQLKLRLSFTLITCRFGFI